uniref:Uncharacterized protein n=1 Tax=Oryza glumipatula TaxID=40148 RepID=A0A0D9YDX8_9ORYZ
MLNAYARAGRRIEIAGWRGGTAAPWLAGCRRGQRQEQVRVHAVHRDRWIWKADTDAAIRVELAAADDSGFAVGYLERWGGLIGAGHDYYERAATVGPTRPAFQVFAVTDSINI